MSYDPTVRMMSPYASQGAAKSPSMPGRAGAAPFRLVRYFSIASITAFAFVAAVLILNETTQGAFFEDVQKKQASFFGDVQKGFVSQQDESARRDLVATYESGNVTLTSMMSNTMWAKDFAPLAVKAQIIPIDHCRALADEKDKNGRTVPGPEKKTCFAEVGKLIMAMPEFRAVDAKVFDVMKKTAVVKIKVFDLRGVTVYSSEHKQVGEDKASNGGWKSAMAGKPASELSHRDKFSAFEGVIEDRDMISSYLPVLGSAEQQLVGVFEVYSDMTPLLAQIKATAAQTAKTAKSNTEKVDAAASANTKEMKDDSTLGMLIVFGLLGVLFAALYFVVRRADRIIKSQNHEREHVQQQLGQNEKMAALGQMVAGVAHQLNTPLAFSRSNVTLVHDQLAEFDAPLRVASKLTALVRSTTGNQVTLNMGRARDHVAGLEVDPDDLETMRAMLKDVLNGIEQMSELVVNMRNFTRLDRTAIGEVDLNHGLKTVVYMAKSVVPNRIRLVEEYGELPPMVCNPSQLNQVFLNMITNASQAMAEEGTITVRTGHARGWVKIEIADTGAGIPPDVLPRIFESLYTTKPPGEGTGLGLSIAMDIVHAHGGDIQVHTEVGRGTTFEINLPVRSAAEMPKAA